jgi:Domain of unknown function (DUF1707)/Inner membrane component of T3SS, cytoplasmic domain
VARPGRPAIRISDADRHRALDTLRDGLTDGRLTHDTFVQRAEATVLARTGGDLSGLVADLPKPQRLRAAAAAVRRRARRSAKRWQRGFPLVLRLPAGSQRRFTIGRELACDMTVTDETVSRWHASLHQDGGGWLLDDLGSTNGTWLNGWRVSTASRVTAGDLVSFGAVTFVLADRPSVSSSSLAGC